MARPLPHSSPPWTVMAACASFLEMPFKRQNRANNKRAPRNTPLRCSSRVAWCPWVSLCCCHQRKPLLKNQCFSFVRACDLQNPSSPPPWLTGFNHLPRSPGTFPSDVPGRARPDPCLVLLVYFIISVVGNHIFRCLRLFLEGK